MSKWCKNYDIPQKSIVPIFAFFSECVAQSDLTLKGICLTNDECDSEGGTKDGNCASGFGVCCII